MRELYDMQNQIFLQETKAGLLTVLVKMVSTVQKIQNAAIVRNI